MRTATVEPDERANALGAYMNAISAQADAERWPPREVNSHCVLLVGVLMIIEKSWARAGSYLGSMGATAAAAASSFMQPKPVFGRREGKRRQQKDRKPRWSDFEQKRISKFDLTPLLKPFFDRPCEKPFAKA